MTQRPAAPPPPLPPREGAQSPRATIPSSVDLNLTSGVVGGPSRIMIYGTGGIGKTTLAAFLPAPIFIDVERSSNEIQVTRDSSVETWAQLRGKLAAIVASPPEGAKSIVIDTATRAEDLACQHVIENRKTDKGRSVSSIEGFGWNYGRKYVYEEFLALIVDLDRVTDAGFHVCLIAHDIVATVPNPSGEDFLRYEPCLHSGDKRGAADVRTLVKTWVDHLLFIGYDVYVDGGKGQGSGLRSISTQELPTHLAKSRARQLSIPFTLDDPGAIWRELGIS